MTSVVPLSVIWAHVPAIKNLPNRPDFLRTDVEMLKRLARRSTTNRKMRRRSTLSGCPSRSWSTTTSPPSSHFLFTAWKVAGRGRPRELRSNYEVYSVCRSRKSDAPKDSSCAARRWPGMANAAAMLLDGHLGTRKLASYEVWCQHLSPKYHSPRSRKQVSSLYGRDHAIFIPMDGILPWVPLYLDHVNRGIW